VKQLYIVGIGPGGRDGMTYEAAAALGASDCIVGYHVYTELIQAQFPDKMYYTTPMTQEVDRCRQALELADQGHIVSLVCSGDAGVYGMSGPVWQLHWEFPQVEVTVVAGVTAALAGAAILGAPLIHDFALISLSDLLTPWEKIEKRLRLAAEADFVIVLYNPSSRKRHDYLQKAVDLVLEHQSGNTVCGLVENIGREGQRSKVLSLKELREEQVNMFTTVFIGNSQTRVIEGKMVTPRGYVL
jgi:precorrin-3B C17-methyltransferase